MRQRLLHPPHAEQLVHHVRRQPDRLALVRQRAPDALLDPPRRVGAQLAALLRVEPVHGLHQAHVAFADQIQQRQSQPRVIPRDLDDQPQVRADHLLPRRFVALLDAPRELHFLLGREEGDPPDFAQVDPHAMVVAFVHIDIFPSRRKNCKHPRA